MKFKKTISSFDIESTGTDVIKDRIIELSVCLIEPNGRKNQETFRFNPGKSSHPEALKVHGITDEELEYEPNFKDVAKELFDTCFKGKDLHGFNIKKFDIPMLSEEFARVGILFPEQGTLIYDSMVIFHKQNPRDLQSAHKYYIKEDLQNAHSAESDVAATVNIFEKQIMEHFNENMTPEELAAYCTEPGIVDIQGKLKLNDEGVICFNFGKSKGIPVKQDRSYANWMLNQDSFTRDTKMYLRIELGIESPLATKKPDEVRSASSVEEDELF